MENSSFQNMFSFLDDKLLDANINLNAILDEIKSNNTADVFYSCLKHIFEVQNNPIIIDKLLHYLINNFDKNYLSIVLDFIVKSISNSRLVNQIVMAIKFLPKFNDLSCTQVLLFCLNDKNSNYKIKLASAEALGKIGDKNAFEALGRIATDENVESAYIKESAVTALGMLGDERAIDVFSSIMNTKQIFKEKFSFLKEKIMEAMDKFDISRNKKALEIIKTSLYDNNISVRISAIETLMNSDIEKSFDLISDVFKFDDSIEVKKNALVAMYNIKDDIKILEDIIRSDYCDEIKNFAIETIKEIEENNNEY